LPTHFRRKTKREKPFRRGAFVQEIRPKPRRERRKWFTRGGQHIPITPPTTGQRRRELTPLDLLKGAARQLGPFGVNLTVGLQKTSTQVGPAVRQLSTMTKRRPEAARPIKPTSPSPLLRGLGTKGLVPVGAGLRQIDREILQQRTIGTPQIIDKQDVLSGGKENELRKYVKEAMGAMPIGTDTASVPEVIVMPRNQFDATVPPQMKGRTTARTVGPNRIEVSEQIFDLAPKHRAWAMKHEAYHARKHFGSGGWLLPQEGRESEANRFANSIEPEGANLQGRWLVTSQGRSVYNPTPVRPPS